MYFSKVTLKPTHNQADFANMVCSNTYKEHQILWKLFGDEADTKRDFIYRYEPQNGKPAYYIVSQRQPVDSEYLWDIQSKNYAPVLEVGQRLSFTLRVNPVIKKNGQRHDAVMHEKHRIDYKNMDKATRPSNQEIVEKAGLDWLQSRSEQNGFSIDNSSVRIDGYQPHTSGRKRGSKEIRYSTMDFQGILTITDTKKFEKTLMQGIGKAKAFGCGLLLVRRI